MKKKLCIFATCLTVTVLMSTVSSAFAANENRVTYRVPFFNDIVRTVSENAAPTELFLSDLRGDLYGMTGHKLVTDELSLAWYADAACTLPYGFETAAVDGMILYGKVQETGRNLLSDGFGWDVRSGKIYAGNPIDDRYFTSDDYTPTSYTDPATGTASFRFSGSKYAVYGRGLSVAKPFSVTLDFTEGMTEGSPSWFIYSIYPALTLAQAGMQAPWANAGAGSAVMFNLGSGAPQAFQTGTSFSGVSSTLTTIYPDGGEAFRALFADGNKTITLTASITEEGTVFTAGDKTVATSPAKRSDFPSGYAYLNFATTGSAFQDVSFDVSVEQEAGVLSVRGEHVTLGSLSVSGMAVTLPIAVEEGYAIERVTANGAELSFVEVYGKKGVYALDLTAWGENAEIMIQAKKEGAEGCGCSGTIGAGAALLAGLSLAAFQTARFFAKKRGER